MRDPTLSLEETPEKTNVSKCVHGKNHVPQQDLEHAVSVPSNSGLEDDGSSMDTNHSLKDVPETRLNHPLQRRDADISAFAKDSSRWLDDMTFD